MDMGDRPYDPNASMSPIVQTPPNPGLQENMGMTGIGGASVYGGMSPSGASPSYSPGHDDQYSA